MTNSENERLMGALQSDIKNVTKTVDDLKNGDIKEIRDNIKALPEELTRRLDERYANKDMLLIVQNDLKEIKETVDPLTKLRRHLWWLIIAGMVVASVSVDYIKEKIKGV